jgi:predicted transcriptional regulator
MLLATGVWHYCRVERKQAMTELLEAVEDVRAQSERVARLAAALFEASEAGVRQRDLVTHTGLTRETIRRHIEDEKIRRNLIDPTPRYLAAQERKRRAAED